MKIKDFYSPIRINPTTKEVIKSVVGLFKEKQLKDLEIFVNDRTLSFHDQLSALYADKYAANNLAMTLNKATMIIFKFKDENLALNRELLIQEFSVLFVPKKPNKFLDWITSKQSFVGLVTGVLGSVTALVAVILSNRGK